MIGIDSSSARPEHRITSLDISVTPLTAKQALEEVVKAAKVLEPTLIGAHNLHSVYLFHTNDRFRHFYDNADLVLVDGWPILAAVNRDRNRAGDRGLQSDYRIGSTDWIPAAISSPDVSRVCVIGASSASNAEFIDRHSQTNQEVEFLGYPGDPWPTDDLATMLDKVSTFQPQLTLVAMGMPLQEEVALALKEAGVPGVIATVGGAVDQLSGTQALAPRWTGRMKVEWLWRLASNPRRLAHRYLVEPIKLFAVLRQRGQRPH